MPTLVTFAGQNWVITPAALAVNQIQPPSISEQSWLLVLSGVCVVNLQGNAPNDWLRDTITIYPDIISPIEWAIGKWLIPVPQNPDISLIPVFSLEEWAPFAAVSSVVNNSSGGIDLGFAVEVWRPSHFIQTYKDQNNQPIPNVFTGIDVDIAVRNNNSTLQRVSYNITLLGKIAFTPNPIV